MIADIWRSFTALPLWVRIWIALILVPINLAAALFWSHPSGLWIALLAIGGMTPNLALLLFERGFSKAMAFAHLILWPPLVVLILTTLSQPLEAGYRFFLTALLLVDGISLAFDVPDAWKWWKGARSVPGHEG